MDINDKDFFSLESEQFDGTVGASYEEFSIESLNLDVDQVSLLELDDGLDGIAVAEGYLAQVNAGNESIELSLNYQNTIIAVDSAADEDSVSYEAFIADAVSKSEVLEDDEVSTEGFKDVVKKIWQAIVIAFKKLGMAIANFIKTVQTKIGEMGNGAAAKFFEANKGKIKDYEKSAAKFKGIKPKKAVKFTDIMKTVDKDMGVVLSAFDKYSSALDAVGTSIDVKSKKGGTKKKVLTLANQMKDTLKSINKAAALGTKIEGKGESLPNATLVVREFVWGESKPKAAEISVKDYLTKVDFLILSANSAGDMKKAVIVSKNALKGTQASQKIAIKLAKLAENIATSKDADGTKEGTDKEVQNDKDAAVQLLARQLNVVKLGYSHAISIILNAYKEFFRARGYVMTAVKAAKSGETSTKK